MDTRTRALFACLIMAAVFGLAGFSIVYYHATFERPREHFAIVVDAGSTQTRSSLYHVSVHRPKIIEFTRPVTDVYADYNHETDLFPAHPLADLIQVRQVGSCVNGGPLASVSSPLDAQNLINTCLVKFTRLIKLLDFVETSNVIDANKAELGSLAATMTASSDDSNPSVDAEQVSQQLAQTRRRVNSVTHLHLGATAGMRMLEEVNWAGAEQKMNWVSDAISRSNELLADGGGGPYVNKGFVGIIQGSDEALFGWLSVNFVCETLYVHAPPPPPTIEPAASARNGYNVAIKPNDAAASHLSDATDIDNRHTGSGGGHFDKTGSSASSDLNQLLASKTVGTLELGGASAQMALQVADNKLGSWQINNMSLDEQNFSLLNGHYRLATRSDLCLGMSQAVLRLTYVLLHKHLLTASGGGGDVVDSEAAIGQQLGGTELIVNPCLQRGSRLKLSPASLAAQWSGACLAPNDKLETSLAKMDSKFRERVMHLNGSSTIVLVGTGNVEQCEVLLSNLVDPKRCSRYFSLCPRGSNQHGPPKDVQFVTMSGYNHALNVLNLTAQAKRLNQGQISKVIDEKLGGNWIDYGEFTRETSEFCSTNLDQLLARYPKLGNGAHQNYVCLQLIYIRKLLIEFYRFDPATSWSQINFLIFTPKSVPNQFATLQGESASAANKQNKLDIRRDIGWTIGLILNETSYQVGGSDDLPNQIYFHHGASIVCIIRATIALLLASCFVTMALLLVRIVELRHAKYQTNTSISHWQLCSSSSYDISILESSLATKRPVRRYVLNP